MIGGDRSLDPFLKDHVLPVTIGIVVGIFWFLGEVLFQGKTTVDSNLIVRTLFSIAVTEFFAEIILKYLTERKHRYTLALFRQTLVDIPDELRGYAETRIGQRPHPSLCGSNSAPSSWT